MHLEDDVPGGDWLDNEPEGLVLESDEENDTLRT